MIQIKLELQEAAPNIRHQQNALTFMIQACPPHSPPTVQRQAITEVRSLMSPKQIEAIHMLTLNAPNQKIFVTKLVLGEIVK